MGSTPKQLQKEELEALTSMYNDALKDLRSNRGKHQRPPHFSVTIKLLQSDCVIATEPQHEPSFDLIVQETPKYPHELPEIELINPRNIPNDALVQCEQELTLIMQENLGQVMMFQLIQHAREFLDQYRPKICSQLPVQISPIIETNPENETDQQIEREIDEIRERYSKEAEKQRHHRLVDHSRSKQVNFSRILSETTIKFEQPREITVRRGHSLHKETHPTSSECILHVSYLCTDCDSANIYCLHEWNFDNPDFKDQEDFLAQYRREIGNIENEIKGLMKHQHHCLLKIVAYQYRDHNDGCFTFRVLTEWPEASSLEVFDSCPVSESLLKKIATALCEALAFIHSKSIIHRGINATSVYLCATGVKLARTSFVRRLNNLHIYYQEGQTPRSVHGSPKNDIYDMGILLLNLSTGRVHQCIIDAPSTLSDKFRNFLQRCANGESLKQLSSDAFLVHAAESQKNFDRLMSDSDTHDTSSSNPNRDGILVSPQSRLTSDFEVIGMIGQGGFGHVFKVQNKLDGCFYAVKQILLKSANKHVNKKITREVKLLSKLNHQNIVRYYSTWTEQMALRDESKSISGSTKSKSMSKRKSLKNGDSLRDQVNIVIPELSSSNEHDHDDDDDDDSSSSSTQLSDDESGVFDTRSFHPVERSEVVIFFDDNDNDDNKSEHMIKLKEPSNSSSSTSSSEKTSEGERIQRVLFIQMEYCEGNTLKQLIERCILQEKPAMIWMLLREILDGLRHMHSEGIIHRDLKPGNILLDANGHAKIGDLGLATISKLSGYTDSSAQINQGPHSRSSWSVELKDGSGLVSSPAGTKFYMAPELLNCPRIAATEKVDIYSVGITFFEMCYPFNTSMERAKTLTEIRLPAIHVPEHFKQKPFEQHYELLKQMLNHDPDQRPSANTLLESNIIPIEQKEQFEQLLDTMFDSQNDKLQSRYYEKTIRKLFQRKNPIALDATFDTDLQLDFNHLAILHRDSQIHTNLRNSFVRICEKYGAFLIRLPILLPDPSIYNKPEFSTLKYLSSSGLVVSLPFDSKVPLARFIARCVSHHGLDGLTTLRCYQIGNVYRNTNNEMHPKELTECGYDIIFTENTLLPDAEILALSKDVLEELQIFKKRNVFIRLNHSQLIRAILMYYDIPMTKINSCLTAIHKNRSDSSHSSIAMHLIDNGVNDQIAKRIQSLIDIDGPFDDVIKHFKICAQANTEGSKLMKQIIEELETIVKYARLFGVTTSIHLTAQFVTLNSVLDINTFSGFFFQFASVVQRKRGPVYEVYAGGGRYDSLLAQFRRPSQKNHSYELPHIVGVSFGIERFLQMTTVPKIPTKLCDTAICLANHPDKLLNLRLELVQIGVGIDVLHQLELPLNFYMLDEYCISCGYKHLIYMKDPIEGFRLRTYENKNAPTDNRLSTDKILQQYREELQNNTNLLTSTSNGTLTNEIEQIPPQSTLGTPSSLQMKSTPSLSTINTTNEPISSGAQLNVYLYFIEAVNKAIPKKRIEIQIQYKLSTLLSWFTSKGRIEVFVFDLPDTILTTLTSSLRIEDESSYKTSVETIIDNIHNTRYRDTINSFADKFKELRFFKKSKLFVISSYKTDFCRFMAAFT